MQCSSRTTGFLPFLSHGCTGWCSHWQELFTFPTQGHGQWHNRAQWGSQTTKQHGCLYQHLVNTISSLYNRVLDIRVLLLLFSWAGLNLMLRLAYLPASFTYNQHKVPHTRSQCLSPVSPQIPPSKLSAWIPPGAHLAYLPTTKLHMQETKED